MKKIKVAENFMETLKMLIEAREILDEINRTHYNALSDNLRLQLDNYYDVWGEEIH